MSSSQCPCGQGQYIDCCQPLHHGQIRAQSAEQLMRSRYSAFAKQQIDYIVQTTALGQQKALDVAAILNWSQVNQWLKLEIISHQEKIAKRHAQVEFKAHYQDGLKNQIHHEVSHFVQHQGVWYFLDPTTEIKISLKQACLCGSGKKFKQCCAAYL